MIPTAPASLPDLSTVQPAWGVPTTGRSAVRRSSQGAERDNHLNMGSHSVAAPDSALPFARVQRAAHEHFHVPYVERSISAPNGLRWRAWPALFDEPRKERRLSMNNQGAFDTALLHLLIQGHGSLSSSGRSQLRGPQGVKSANGALKPDGLNAHSKEGKTLQQLLAAYNPEYLPLRRHLSGVGLPLLNALQDLHDRTGECLPSSSPETVLAGGQRIARMFGSPMRMRLLWSA